MDIGANIGWYTLAAASNGFKVKAYEPFEQNTFAIKYAKCLNKPEISDNIELNEHALGAENKMCKLYSQEYNH